MKENIHRHRLGRKSYYRARRDWIRQQRLPNSEQSESSVVTEGSEVTSKPLSERVQYRSLEWILAREKRMSDGTWDVDPDKPQTVAVAKQVVSVLTLNFL